MTRNLLLFFILSLWACKTIYMNSGNPPEPYRPLFHFTPPQMWMNDPNGLVYYEGEYHLFYQYYPEATVWGPMHWGHAVSTDLVHWQHLPIALFPDSLGYIFSGSAVIDWNNTSKLGKSGKPPMVAIFTHHNMDGEKAGTHDFQFQSLAYSNDKGRTWTKYPGNPVLPNTEKIRDFRDPHVRWDADSKQWILVLAAQNHVKIYGSPDLIHWSHLSDFGENLGAHGGVWECPDLLPMTVENIYPVSSPNEKKWVLLQSLNPGGPNGGSATQYFVGRFDGKNFTLDPDFAPLAANGKAMWLDWGKDNYAGVTWADIPASDGRTLFVGWMSNWEYATKVPTKTWRSAMTLPRSLHLKRYPEGLRLTSEPIKELEKLRTKPTELNMADFIGMVDLSSTIDASSMELQLEVETGLPGELSIELSNDLGERYIIGYNAARNVFFSDRSQTGKHDFSETFAAKRTEAPRLTSNKHLSLHLFFDVASCELFADGGLTAITEIYFPTHNFSKIKLQSNRSCSVQLKGYSLQRASK